MKRYRMYVNGEWVESGGGGYFPVYDPSTEEIIAEVPESNAADVDRTVDYGGRRRDPPRAGAAGGVSEERPPQAVAVRSVESIFVPVPRPHIDHLPHNR